MPKKDSEKQAKPANPGLTPDQGGKAAEASVPRRRRRFFNRRTAVVSGLAVLVLVLLLALTATVLYRTGVFDNYTRNQFRAKMADIGIVFNAEVFRVTVAPLGLELRNASFNDKLTGEPLFFIRDAQLGMTVADLLSLRLSRDINIDKTDINGAEIWVKFDEAGKSNFSNLKLVEDQAGSAVNFRYDSVVFSLADSVVHFGDLSRKISGNGNNLRFLLSPVAMPAIGDPKRYNFDLTSTDSNFVYDISKIEKIDVRATGVADNTGAELTNFELKTPIGESTLTGTLTDWAAPKYNFDITSSVDLTQASSIFFSGTPLTGVGNFKGKVTGAGETYHIEGAADAESLRAGGIFLKAVNVAATVEGTNTNYQANGKAIAQMLTFEDFRVDFLSLVGNVRGTGTDFRWVGELEAAAAKSKSMTIGGLFLADAVAEYKDRHFTASSGNGRARKFAIGDTEFAELTARNLKFSMPNGGINLTAPSAHARSFTTPDYSLQGVNGSNVRVKNANHRTDVEVDALTSETAGIKNSKLKNVSADKFRFTDLPLSTEVSATNMRAGQVDAVGAQIFGLETPQIDLENKGGTTTIYSDKLRIAKIDAGSAVLGSLNIGGVRLTIRQGTIEGRSDDIDAGDVAITKNKSLVDGGTLSGVKIAHPVFVVEPSGRYRASADMSIGGGALGSVALGAATTKVDINNDRVALNDLTAAVMNGSLSGQAIIAFNERTQSKLNGDFSNLDIAKLLALRSGRVIPLEGQTTGRVDLTFNGTNFETASGALTADITASAGSEGNNLIPVTGKVRLSAVNGLFNVDQADLKSPASDLSATGRFDLRDQNSNLALALKSTDANEVERLVQVLGLSPDLEHQMESMEVHVAGALSFDGTITGNLFDPVVDGRASLASLSLRSRTLGSVTSDIRRSPTGLVLSNGKLDEGGAGGSAVFNVDIPFGGENNVTVKATLTNMNAGNLLAALPVDLPERIRDLDGRTSGTVDISGLPNKAQGAIDLAAANGTIAGQAFDSLKAKAVFNGTLIELETGTISLGTGSLNANGTYDRVSGAFNVDLAGKTVPVPLVLAFLPKNDSIPIITGDVDFTAKATGDYERTSSYNINFGGNAANVVVGENAVGAVTFKGQTAGQVLTADMTAILEGRPQVVNASVNFGNDNMPFMVATVFDQSPLAPFLAFVPALKDLPVTGTATGRVDFGGNLQKLDASGNRVFSKDDLSGTMQFSQLALQIQDTPLSAIEPVSIKFNMREVVFEKVCFGGGGSNMTIAGTVALTEDGVNDLSIDGRVNLNLINIATKDIFFSGFADASVRLVGPKATARLSGTASVENGSVAAFIGSDRLTFDRVKTRIIFTSNQAEIEQATGYLGGGKFQASGGVLMDGLSPQSFRFSLTGENVTVPLPRDFITTGDARLELSGIRASKDDPLQVTIAGHVFAKRSLYSKDIELANIVGTRHEASLSSGGGSFIAPRFDLIIEGRDALIVRNNIADLTASVSLALTGDADNPRLAGRIIANSGTIFFRKDRYEVQRGVLEFPPDTAIDPIINLQAESEIGGYQVFVNLSGPLRDSELLSAVVRSSPALPQADVVSLITTGNLSNTAGGIPTLAQTGINTAAEILTDTIINNPARKATDKLFGLNVFEIDPIISGQQLNPSARLTVGRQINNNLRVTYSTNLSQDQNQVLALEYRVSNKLSFVAQYEHRSLSNVTRQPGQF